MSYPAQWGSQNVHVGPAGYAPTSNPMPESEHPWQPQLSTHHNQRRSHNQHHPGLVQPISWSRNDSVDSDYDSTYGLDQEPVGIDHPVGVHPEQMQNFYTNPSHQMESQVPHHGQHGEYYLAVIKVVCWRCDRGHVATSKQWTRIHWAVWRTSTHGSKRPIYLWYEHSIC